MTVTKLAILTKLNISSTNKVYISHITQSDDEHVQVYIYSIIREHNYMDRGIGKFRDLQINITY